MKRAARAEQPAIVMREGESEEDIILIDPMQRDATHRTTVDILNVSRDGKLLAYAVREGGDDCHSVEFFDVDHKLTLPDRISRGRHRNLVFSFDSRGIYYSQELVDSAYPDYRAVYCHLFGTPSEEDTEVFSAGLDRNVHVFVIGSMDCKYIGYYVMHCLNDTVIDFYLQDLINPTGPELVVKNEADFFSPFLWKGNVIALSDWRAPNRRLVLIDPKRPNRNSWLEIIPESNNLIQQIALSDDYIFVSYGENMGSRIEIFDWKGRNSGALPVPHYGTVAQLSYLPDIHSIFYSFSSFDRPPEIHRYHIDNRKDEVWAQSKVPFDPSSIAVEQVYYRSKDGTIVPMFMLKPARPRHAGCLPTLVYGYGGFGTSITPQFGAYTTFLVEHGCLVAFPNIRGGGELGREWHLAGRRHNQQNSIDDFIAAVEWLVSNGYSEEGKVGIAGGSNGGMLVGAALTQRPDLFRAVLCLGPLLDMLRYHLFDSADMQVEEYGVANNPDDFSFLYAYSPYHHVTEGGSYPAVMLISGAMDTRCNPMHARKMTARLQSATSSKHPILLEYRLTWGHWPAQALNVRVDALTRRLSFMCHELGVTY
jgi:prolyl oligopeptidase